MNQNNDQLTLDRAPTPTAESQDFQNPDEKSEERARAHHLAVLQHEQGSIGKLIGSNDTSLTIAFVVIVVSGFSLFFSLIGLIWVPAFAELAKLSFTALMTVAGYVFGLKSGKSD